MDDKQFHDAMIKAIRKWVRQRPGLEFGNYGDVSAYRAELRGITRQRHDAEMMLGRLAWRTVTREQWDDAFGAFSGRLQYKIQDDGTIGLSYCTGQYWCTEYRAAACAVLASLLWQMLIANVMEHPDYVAGYLDKSGEYAPPKVGKVMAGDYYRAAMRQVFGRGVQQRWFR